MNESTFQVTKAERQLCLDDHGIRKIENLTETLHQPTKKGAVIRPDWQNGVGSVQTRSAPSFDPERGIYQFWDCAATPPDLHETGISCSGYYESRDGLHWSKPIVGQIEYRGSRENNYVFVRVGEKHYRADCVIRDPIDPDPARRYKLPLPNIGFAVSPDGLDWTLLDVPGVPSADEFNFSFDPLAHLYILTVKHNGPYGRSVFLSTSPDYEQWTEPELIFHADDLDQALGRERIRARFADPTLEPPAWHNPEVYNVDVYNMGIFRYEGLYIGTPAMYHAVGKPYPEYPNTCGFHLVQLACSRDLKDWHRLGDRRAFIGPSTRGGGAYDLMGLIGPSAPVMRGDELWLYYTASKHRGIPDSADPRTVEPDSGAVCLAVLRRDGFISLDADDREGTMLTKPFILPDGALHLNAASAFNGAVEVQVCGADDNSLETLNPIDGDHCDVTVPGSSDALKRLVGQRICLRFRLRHAQLYSYWFE